MLQFHTENSLFEIDPEQKRIRRLKGTAPIGGNLVADGSWQDYDLIFGLSVGSRAAIYYSDPGKSQTLTSPIRSIEGEWTAPSETEIASRFPEFNEEELEQIAAGRFRFYREEAVDEWLDAFNE